MSIHSPDASGLSVTGLTEGEAPLPPPPSPSRPPAAEESGSSGEVRRGGWGEEWREGRETSRGGAEAEDPTGFEGELWLGPRSGARGGVGAGGLDRRDRTGKEIACGREDARQR